jgi:hypothetical protein
MNTTVGTYPTFDWYTIVSGSTPLEQGDLLDDFPVIVPLPSLVEVSEEPVGAKVQQSATIQLFNVVVMTQSCDFAKLCDEDEVVLCSRYGYSEIIVAEPRLRGQGGWKNLIHGRIIGVHIINKCDIENHGFDYQVIDLRRVFSAPFSVVKQAAIHQGDRVRLLPPYREHLAQAFARRFMRVGLPIDLPREYPYQG